MGVSIRCIEIVEMHQAKKNEEMRMALKTDLIADLMGTNPFFIDSSKVEELLQVTGMSKQVLQSSSLKLAHVRRFPIITSGLLCSERAAIFIWE